MKNIKAWFSFCENENYKGEEPYFFNLEDKPWKALLENNCEVIYNELVLIINADNKNIVPYYNKNLASVPAAWTIFPIIFWGKKNLENQKKVPVTSAIINQIPGVMSYGFSILKPNSVIKPHFGDSNVMYRCHLTLKCNGTIDEIGMRVGDEKITWEKGKLFAFCDAYNHEVWNKTNEERWVMIIDILREDFSDKQERICKIVNATLWWQLKFQNFYFFKHLPRWCRKCLIELTVLVM
jgi:ornithine lipid ester-linked acyl 2-hydroxylase